MFSALLDTNALAPSLIRDVLLEVADHDVYRPLWSSEVLTELERTVTKLLRSKRQDEQSINAYVARLLAQMTTTFPDATIDRWQWLEPSIVLPDPNDRHVVAAAVVGRADVIVTNNGKDFPAEALPEPLFTQTPEEFLLDALDLHTDRVILAVNQVAARTGRHGPPRTSLELAARLRATGCPIFTEALTAALRAPSSAHP